MLNIIYLTDTETDTLLSVSMAGFDGYVAFGPYRAEIPWAFYHDYYDEPEANIQFHQARYVEFRDNSKPEARFVDYGRVDDAQRLGVWHTDNHYMGFFRYPVKDEWFFGRLWAMYVTLPQKIMGFMKLLPEDANVIAVLQAFGAPELNYLMPSESEMKTMKWIWRWLAGDRLKAWGYFVWYNKHEPQWNTMKLHPELWPKNL